MFMSPADARATSRPKGPRLLHTIPQYVPQAVLQNPHLQARQRNCAVLVVHCVKPPTPASPLAHPLLPELNAHATEQFPCPPQQRLFASTEHPAQPHI